MYSSYLFICHHLLSYSFRVWWSFCCALFFYFSILSLVQTSLLPLIFVSMMIFLFLSAIKSHTPSGCSCFYQQSYSTLRADVSVFISNHIPHTMLVFLFRAGLSVSSPPPFHLWCSDTSVCRSTYFTTSPLLPLSLTCRRVGYIFASSKRSHKLHEHKIFKWPAQLQK